MSKIIYGFWKWYEKNKTFTLELAALLFALQLIHLYWLTTDVVAFRLLGKSFFNPSQLGKLLIVAVDFLEIPAIVTTSLVYLNVLRKKFNFVSTLFLVLINSQWLHIFWITDAFVLDSLTGGETRTILPFWLAWVAIFIDYLELPVIFDTLKKFFNSLKTEGIIPALSGLKVGQQKHSQKS